MVLYFPITISTTQFWWWCFQASKPFTNFFLPREGLGLPVALYLVCYHNKLCGISLQERHLSRIDSLVLKVANRWKMNASYTLALAWLGVHQITERFNMLMTHKHVFLLFSNVLLLITLFQCFRSSRCYTNYQIPLSLVCFKSDRILCLVYFPYKGWSIPLKEHQSGMKILHQMWTIDSIRMHLGIFSFVFSFWFSSNMQHPNVVNGKIGFFKALY